MNLILSYPCAIWATVTSARGYLCTTVTEDGSIVTVHSPGTCMSGYIAPGLKILIHPHPLESKATHSTYYILAMATPHGLIGGNPSLSNLIFAKCAAKKLIPFTVVDTEVTVKDSRFDFTVVTPASLTTTYAEVKSCFFVYNDICYFPLDKLSDLPKLHVPSRRTKALSERAVKHFKAIAALNHVIVFVAHNPTFKQFQINPWELVLKKHYDLITQKYVLKIRWGMDKNVYFESFQKL